MADPLVTYRELAAMARGEAAELARETIARLYMELAAVLVRLDAEALRNPGSLSAERAAALLRSLERYREALVERFTIELTAAASRAIGLGPAAQARALRAAEALAGVTTGASFDEVPRRAVEALMARRQLAGRYGLASYSDLFRTVSERMVENLGREVDRLLTSAVARGISTERATTELAAILAKNDPPLLRAIERLGARGGLSTRVGRLQDLPDPDTLAEARQLMAKARRVARTEIIESFRQGDRAASAESPVVRGLRWTLSSNHGAPCACEVYARLDLHGLGPGVFYPETAPAAPHPHCACYFAHVLRPPAEWDEPKATPQRPRRIDRASVEALMPDRTERYVRTVIEAARSGLSLAHQHGTETLKEAA